MKLTTLLMCALILSACNLPQDKNKNSEETTEKPQRPVAIENEKFFEVNGTPMLYGGEDSTQHFDISNLELEPEQFHYGIGREHFPALLEPEFTTVEDADKIWSDDERFLLAYAGDEVKAYSVKDLTRHEVVNDELNGEPIMAAYCILADLGAIYKRTYGDQTLTFALTGYTYYDEEVWDGLDGFMLWDRETESMWWPLIDKAVSGPLKGVELLLMDEQNWKDTTWGYIKANYPDAQVLISGQDFERPDSWNKEVDVQKITENYSIEPVSSK